MSYMVTTLDNPHDPLEDFKAWDQWDRAHGYYTSSYLDRVAGLPEEVPDVIIDKVRDDAIMEMVELHNGQVYKAILIPEESTSPSPAA